MKKHKMAFAVIISALIIVIGSIVITYAADPAPGSADDPVVTKSYVDKAIETLKKSLGGSAETSASNEWEAVFVEAGKSVMGAQGTQLILRSGEAVAIDNGSNGVSDLTAGADLMSGETVYLNHLLLIPRADGRGVKCSTECWFMVLGSYEIK